MISLGVALHLVFGIAETAGGEDSNGWMHFIPAAILAVLLYLAVGHPFGVGLTLLALVAVLAALLAIDDELDWPVLGLALPPLVSGALLIAASRDPGPSSTRRPPA